MHLDNNSYLINKDLIITRTNFLNTEKELKKQMKVAKVDLEMIKATQTYRLASLWKNVMSSLT